MAHPVWLFLSALAAAPPPAPADQTIVVTGSRPTQNAIARYVDGITVDVDGQIATFRQPICPASFGLPQPYNRVVEQRLRDDAVRVGLRVADTNCDPNVVLIVGDAPVPLLKTLQRKRPQMFVGLEFAQIRDLLTTSGPVHTWQAVEPQGTDGRPLQRVMFLESQSGPPRPVGGNGAWLNPAASNSRIQQNIQSDLVASFVVIDTNAIDGLTLTQIADYAAMRALAKTRASSALGSRSILGLFDDPASRATTEQLTGWDWAYLRGLYATDKTRTSHAQQSAIVGAIWRELNER